MSKITKECGGCARLLNPNDPLCKKCEEQSNYKSREMFISTGAAVNTNPFERLKRAFNLDMLADCSAFTAVKLPPIPEIKKVIFNYPTTVVLWTDGTKTIVRAQGDDVYDPEKGLAMAICKKALGNTGRYYEVFKKWVNTKGE